MALDISVDVEQLDTVLAKMRNAAKSLEEANGELRKAVGECKPMDNPLTNQIVPIWEGVAPKLAQINEDWEALTRVIQALVEQQKALKEAETKNALGMAFDQA